MKPFRRVLSTCLSLLLVTGMTAGCVTDIFSRPLTISTSADAAMDVKPLGRVSVERCNYLFVVIPVVRDPKKIFDDLLQEAMKKGGNAVVDFELRSTGNSFMFFPIFVRSCFEGVGEAVSIARK